VENSGKQAFITGWTRRIPRHAFYHAVNPPQNKACEIYGWNSGYHAVSGFHSLCRVSAFSPDVNMKNFLFGFSACSRRMKALQKANIVKLSIAI
jgi:hypothetical protein